MNYLLGNKIIKVYYSYVYQSLLLCLEAFVVNVGDLLHVYLYNHGYVLKSFFLTDDETCEF